MKRCLLLCALLLAVVGQGLRPEPAAALPQPPPILPDLRGVWVTVLPDVDTDIDLLPLLDLELNRQRNRAFFGEVAVAYPADPRHPPNPIFPPNPCRVSISNTGVINLQSRMTGASLNGRGQYVADEFGDMLLLSLQVQHHNGTRNLGTVTLVRIAE